MLKSGVGPLSVFLAFALPVSVFSQSADLDSSTSVASLGSNGFELASAIPHRYALPDSRAFAAGFDAGRRELMNGEEAVVPVERFASKYADTIEPGYRAGSQGVVEKWHYTIAELVSLHYLGGSAIAAEYSQLRGLDPKYGSNGEAFLQRLGAAGARGAGQIVYSAAVLAPILHEDTRYYVLGSGHHVVTRLLYAASRVFVTRSDSGRDTLNIAQLVGYGGSAATSQIYYPVGDRNFNVMLRGYRSSLEGLAIDHEGSEFLRFLFRHQPRY